MSKFRNAGIEKSNRNRLLKCDGIQPFVDLESAFEVYQQDQVRSAQMRKKNYKLTLLVFRVFLKPLLARIPQFARIVEQQQAFRVVDGIAFGQLLNLLVMKTAYFRFSENRPQLP